MSSYTKPAPKFALLAPGASFDPAKDMPVYKLNSGYDMPVIAYGTFRSTPGEVGGAVLNAIKAGYRHFDFAHLYMNEKEIGEVLAEAFSTGLVKREDLFITSKLWNNDHQPHVVPQACDISLKNLQLDYLDLYLIHFPVAWKKETVWDGAQLGDTPLIDTWRAMEKLVDEGKVRSIGVSNYPLMLMHDLVNQARIQPANNQIEVHPFYTRESLVNYCLSRNICVTAHTPLGGGVRNKADWGSDTPMTSPVIVEIATAKNKSPAQVMLRWSLQLGVVPLPKSVRKERIEQNIDVFDFELSPEEMEKISALDKYVSYKTNPNPLSAPLGGPDAFCKEGTDIFD